MRWSDSMAYVIGLIASDGNLTNDGRHLNLTSKDFEQIENFKSILKLKNKVSLKESSYSGIKKYYFIQFGNVKFYNYLISIGLHPNKSKSLKSLFIPDKYFGAFLRGLLDGDGYTYSYWDKRWNSSFMLYTGFVSASKDFLDWISQTIFRLYHLSGSMKYSGRSTYGLSYAKRGSIVLFSKMYPSPKVICLLRKRYKFESALGIITKQAGMLEQVDRHA